MLWPKYPDWLNGYKNKTPIYDLETHIGRKWGIGKIYFMQKEIKRNWEYQYYRDKMDFKIKTIRRREKDMA